MAGGVAAATGVLTTGIGAAIQTGEKGHNGIAMMIVGRIIYGFGLAIVSTSGGTLYSDGEERVEGSSGATQDDSQKHFLSTSTKSGNSWSRHWRTSSVILSVQLTGIAAAAGHYLLFRTLNGTLADDGYLRQSQVSAISLLLVTIFKGAFTVGVGISFAQYLWHVIRGSATAVSLVETLFLLRSNVFALADLRSILRAPLLYLMALSVWCIGIATIYPPGALTVTLQPYTITNNVNISVWNPGPSESFNPMVFEAGRYSTLGLLFPADQFSIDGNRSHTFDYHYYGPKPWLINMAKSVLVSSQVYNLPVHTGENSTYRLQLRAPQLFCNTSIYNETIPLIYQQDYSYEYGLSALVFQSGYGTSSYRNATSFNVTKSRILAYFTALNASETTEDFEAIVERNSIVCNTYTMNHDINVTYPKGVQTLEIVKSDPMPLLRKDWNFPWSYQWNGTGDETWPFPPSRNDIKSYPQDLQEYIRNSSEALATYSNWAVLDAFNNTMSYTWYESNVQWLSYLGLKPHTLENGTMVNYTTWNSSPFVKHGWENGKSDIEGSVFQNGRFSDDVNSSYVPRSSTGSVYIDPRQDFNITQDVMNEVLTNITLSTLSLGTWWQMTPVTTTRYRNTYEFSHPLNLILPYSISVGVALFFSAVGIWSLYQNDVAVADGGFLQIMMATRGDTEMERLVVRDGAAASDQASQELRDLKIRYGRLLVGNAGGGEEKNGFGTVEETVSLRKRG
ncbi:hypothetical protein K458DRAFT_393589 [Lentithecium fluviatile CBS 122367]|uniref:Uncharacterized protein n=1 Tax=Lentithecium fluviatile CBS 122367 TaxID=1168545 RepID=A0A6G1INC6_9PLEO|nr:hypothetical protein K458DRAFT_393589 [Lentithecium fluviatile CBS 122367]